MNIVIAGGGETGIELCQEFSSTVNIILIEKNKDIVEDALGSLDIEAIVGTSEDVRIQREAGVGTCDLFIAVTDSDEANIISCVVAKNLGAKATLARIREPSFMESANFIKDSLGISQIINPNEEAARKIRELIKFEDADHIDYFVDGKVTLVAFKIDEGLDLIGKKLYEIDWKQHNLIVALIERNDELMVPNGSTTIEKEDRLYLTGDRSTITKFYKRLNINTKPVESVFIIGGSRTAYYLMESLRDSSITIKLVEIDYDKAIKFAANFPEAIVIHGDGTDQNLLKEENIDSYDAVITLTGNDEENLITSLFARHMDIKKTITKVQRNNILNLLSNMDLGTTINLKRILVDRISRFVRSISSGIKHSAINNLYTIAYGQALAVEFEVQEGNKWCGVPLKDLDIKEGLLVTGVYRDREIYIPNGDFHIQPGDIVLVITSHVHYESLEGLLENE